MVYVFLADGFEEIEALAPVDIFRRGDIEVKTVGIGSKAVKGSHGITVNCDISESDIDLNCLDAVILPGGMPGTLNLEKSKTVSDVIDFAYKNGKLIGAICAAPSILGKKGLLSGKNATCFNGFEKDLEGAHVIDLPVVKDGQIITSFGAGAALDFGFELLSALKGEQISAQLRRNMKYIFD